MPINKKPNFDEDNHVEITDNNILIELIKDYEFLIIMKITYQ